jgi:hypothetical protein
MSADLDPLCMPVRSQRLDEASLLDTFTVNNLLIRVFYPNILYETGDIYKDKMFIINVLSKVKCLKEFAKTQQIRID